MPARGQRGRRGRCTCRRQADWEWQRHAPKQDEALAGAVGAVLGVPGRAMRGWGRWWRHYLMLIERKCGVLSHTINEVEGETAAAAKYQKQKQNRKTKRKRKRKELKWRVKRRDETTKHKFFDDSFAARHAKKLPLPVSLFTLPPPPPSLSLSISLSSTTIRFSYVTNVRAFCCCSCFCLEAIGAAVSICSNREKSEFEKWENLNTPQENCFSMSICLLLYCRKQVVKVL